MQHLTRIDMSPADTLAGGRTFHPPAGLRLLEQPDDLFLRESALSHF